LLPVVSGGIGFQKGSLRAPRACEALPFKAADRRAFQGE
jgi:hypothetical protein